MQVIGDFHTHSKYSKYNHGKNTMEELVVSAINRGLKAIAITDHGPNHLFFGIGRKKIAKAKAEILSLRAKYPEIKILFGLETNLLNSNGQIDIDNAERDNLDVCLMGFHKGSYNSLDDLFGFQIGSWCKSKKRIEKNTNAYINAIKNNRIDIITHLQTYIKVNVKEIAMVCAEYGTMIELNNRHFAFSQQDINDMLDTKVMFIIDSDAHTIDAVGEFANSIAFAQKYNIPIERIANVEKMPEFANRVGIIK